MIVRRRVGFGLRTGKGGRMSGDDRHDPLRHSRHKRMPKVWRLGQDAPRAIDPLGDEFRVTIFLTNAQADRAEREAVDSGLGDLQAWCQATLRSIIDRLDSQSQAPGTFVPFVRHRPTVTAAELEAEMGIPDDPAFLREWAGIEEPTPALPAPAAEVVESEWVEESPGAEADNDSNSGDPASFEPLVEPVLAALRAGLRPGQSDVGRLKRALDHFAAATADQAELPRGVVRSLYRLSLEAQVLMTEVHPSMGLDLTVITLVREIQASVGRILDR